MIHDPLSGDPSDASQVYRFSPATLLWRTASSTPKQVALVGPGRRVTFDELADRLVAARAHTPATPARIRRVGPRGDLDAVLAFCESLAQAVPLASVDLLAPDVPTDGLLPLAPRPTPAPRARSLTLDSAAFDALAQVRLLSPTHGLGWTGEALGYAWGMSAPLPGTVSALLGPLGAPIAWPSLFGVLLGRGRVVVPDGSDIAAAIDLIDAEGVSQLHLEPALVRSLATQASRPLDRVKRVCVWTDSAQSSGELHRLASLFPNARISRILAWNGGPIAVASLEDLQTHGDGHIGTRCLGLRLAVSSQGTLLVGGAPWLPSKISIADPDTRAVAHWDTGIPVEKSSRGLEFPRRSPLSMS